MKSKALLATALLTGAALMSGCTLGNGKIDNPLTATPYQSGRTFVFVDVVTSPVQPTEVKVVVNQVYALAQANILNDNLADEFVQAQIAQLYPDATPEFRQVLFNLYAALTARVLDQVDVNPGLPQSEILSEFNRGIRDALALYKPEALQQ